MPISLNAVFNKPTREEKSRKKLLDQAQEFAAGQSALDQSRVKERMTMADQLARGQMEFAKKLGLDYGQKEYDQIRQNALNELTAAGENPSAANSKLGSARSAEIRAAANKSDEEKSRGLLKIPGLRAMFEAAHLDTSNKETRNRGLLADGMANMSYDLGASKASADAAENRYRGAKADVDLSQVGDVANTEATVREQTRQAAEEYKKAGNLRGLLNDLKIKEAEGRSGFLQQIPQGSIYEPIVHGGIDPRAYGAGVTGPRGTGTLPMLGDKTQEIQGLLKPKKTAEEALAEILGGVNVKTD